MAAKVAINGMGRIGRATLKIVMEKPELELVAVNDLVPPDNLAYLLNYDSVYGRYDKKVTHDKESLNVGGRKVRVCSEKDPTKLPWRELGVDLVFECTGVFTKEEDLRRHLEAGAKKVILSAPAKTETMATIVHGVNQAPKDAPVVSCASCTTNSITPVMEVMDRHFGVEKAILTTIHAYTATQAIVDQPSGKDWLRGRAAAVNIVPATTGAAVATAKALPQLKGKFDGIAARVPVPDGSLSDITILTRKSTTVDEVNRVLREEAASERYRGIMGVSDVPLVSSDIIHDDRASVMDLTLTTVVDGNLVKVLAWYDNEWGYTSQMVREAVRMVTAK